MFKEYVYISYHAIHPPRLLHEGMLNAVMRAPMSFFDATPMGRVMNRFSKDTDLIDTLLANTFNNCLNITGLLLAVLVYVAIITRYFIFIVAVVACFGYVLLKYYLQVRRLRCS